MAKFSARLTSADRKRLVAVRRDLHRHPELSFEEVRTAGVAADRLRELGLRPQTGVGKTGVVADLSYRRQAPRVMLRADMDALPILERRDREYHSQNDGVMHACGHDGHVAIGLAVAEVLARRGDKPPADVRFVFQPAEEGAGGAAAMLRDGVLEAPAVHAAFGLHLWAELPLGTIGISRGPLMAAVDKFTIRVLGRGGHGAYPHRTVDPIVAASEIVVSLQSVVSRKTSPLDPAVVTVGSVHGGTAFNIVPESVELVGTVRCFSDELWKSLPELLERCARGVADAHGARVEIVYERVNRATINDPVEADFVAACAAEVVGEKNVEFGVRTMGGEDMSVFLEKAPGCFFFVGASDPDRRLPAPHHSPDFDFDERALAIGAEILVRIGERWGREGIRGGRRTKSLKGGAAAPRSGAPRE